MGTLFLILAVAFNLIWDTYSFLTKRDLWRDGIYILVNLAAIGVFVVLGVLSFSWAIFGIASGCALLLGLYTYFLFWYQGILAKHFLETLIEVIHKEYPQKADK